MKYLSNWGLFESLSESEMSNEQLDIYLILQELVDNGFDVKIDKISIVVPNKFEVSIMRADTLRTGYKKDSLFTWSEVKEGVTRVYDYINNLKNKDNWTRIGIRMWFDSVEVAQGFRRSEQFTIPDGTTQWVVRLVISI